MAQHSRARRTPPALVLVLVLAVALGLCGGAFALAAHRQAAAEREQARARALVAQEAAQAESDWLAQVEQDGARARGDGLRASATDELAEALATAHETTELVADLDDADVDAALTEAIAGAQDVASVVQMRAATAELDAASRAGRRAHADHVAAQEAAAEAARAAEEAARAERADEAEPGSGGTGGAPSCGTTYDGPPFYTSPPTEGGDGSNGKLPPSALTRISWADSPQYLLDDAAAALDRLDAAYVAQFGHHLELDLTYRDYATQVAMREALGSVAAPPGTSSHGTGRALDVPEMPCEFGWGTPQRDWLVANGPAYGWVSPSWARQGGSNPEYWHYEFVG